MGYFLKQNKLLKIDSIKHNTISECTPQLMYLKLIRVNYYYEFILP